MHMDSDDNFSKQRCLKGNGALRMQSLIRAELTRVVTEARGFNLNWDPCNVMQS